MSMLNIVKASLRISDSNYDFDSEIIDLIEQCKDDLGASGVKSDALLDTNIDTDGNIRRLITLYCKSNFGLENPDKDWFNTQYDKKKAETLNQINKYVSVGDVIV